MTRDKTNKLLLKKSVDILVKCDAYKSVTLSSKDLKEKEYNIKKLETKLLILKTLNKILKNDDINIKINYHMHYKIGIEISINNCSVNIFSNEYRRIDYLKKFIKKTHIKLKKRYKYLSKEIS